MKVVYAKTTTMVIRPSGAGVNIRKGEHWPANDPVVRDHPELFSRDPRVGLRVSAPLVDDDDQPVIERATAAPGEKRVTRRRRKATA